MEFKQLKYFIEVAKREHLSEAALELNIAQSAISRQISQLEDELNVSLFRREGRHIYLTETGQRFLAEASKIVEESEHTLKMFQKEQEIESKRIKIGYVESYVSELLTLLIQKFENEYTTTLLPLMKDNEALLHMLLTRDIDVAFMDLSSDLKRHNDLIITPLFEDSYVLYVPKQDPLASATHPPLNQLNQSTLFSLSEMPDALIQQIEHTTRNHIYRISSSRLASYLLKKNRGYVLAPQYALLKENDAWARLSLNHTELKRTICAVIHKDNHKPELKALQNEINALLSHTSVYH
ncbi:LysR family transcriptional regulator [Staphylococcus condimenti]|uniref:LysR family transcriptional regulator n=1 Tax=Staphylococcus condimenti TaxID=70255 RepID=A0AB37GZ88_9STAP|nr:LysR family transcriptional regulator [Staphylococcus condimenti]AMY05725.1 LysR family transcriptional regulator [Staphylococcus condimenti]PNZ59881.1 LysR family transcriptional regulator [Staphylococcus condimenti]QQS82473.1 LysR family transcriptional regulator [Staphylococcus condimenti]QRP95095.1 LysR family transcriptional regulator [Staphylococcus condimenti]VEG65350.1 putative transcription activator of glutamate synthase operon [Staphylococcus condimenti]